MRPCRASHAGKFFEGIVEIDEIDFLRGKFQGFVERQFIAPIALEGAMSASIVHQDLPHQLSCHGEKMFLILKLNPALNQPEIGFMYDRGALQGVIETLPLQVVVRYPAKLVVDQWQQRVQSGVVAFEPGRRFFFPVS
jgi:hypothetical protein